MKPYAKDWKICQWSVRKAMPPKKNHTLETAISNAYSVIKAVVLLEKCATIPITESLLTGLDNLNDMLTEVFDTVNSLVLGKVPLLSGSAEVKSQSSSADAPLLCTGGLGRI